MAGKQIQLTEKVYQALTEIKNKNPGLTSYTKTIEALIVSWQWAQNLTRSGPTYAEMPRGEYISGGKVVTEGDIEEK